MQIKFICPTLRGARDKGKALSLSQHCANLVPAAASPPSLSKRANFYRRWASGGAISIANASASISLMNMYIPDDGDFCADLKTTHARASCWAERVPRAALFVMELMPAWKYKKEAVK